MPNEKPPLIVTPEDAGVMDLSPEELGIVSAGIEHKVEAPSFLEKTISNIPRSLGNVLMHPVGSAPMGAPGAKENFARGEYPEQFQDVLPKIQKFMQHPIDNTVSAIKNTISEHPVESAMGVAALGRQAMPETAAKVDAVVGGAAKGAYNSATEMVPFRYRGHEIDVPKPILGAAAGGGAGWLTHIPGAKEFGAITGGLAPIVKGAYEGGKAGLNEFGRVVAPERPLPAWMTEPDINVKPNLSDVPIGPVNKPVLPSGRTVGRLQETPATAPETPPVQAVARLSTLQPETPPAAPNAPKAQETAPEKSVSEGENVVKSTENTQETPDQWTWEALKDQHGQAAVDRVKAKYSDLASRLKAAKISLETFLDLPQEAKDAIVQSPKHSTQPNRPKYSNGYNPKYENLFKELHGQSE